MAHPRPDIRIASCPVIAGTTFTATTPVPDIMCRRERFARLTQHLRRWPSFAHCVLVALLGAMLAACDSSTEPDVIEGREIAIVLSSIDRALTIFDVDSTTAPVTVGTGPEGSPVSLAVRGATAVVPLGIVPVAAIVDVRSGQLAHSVALPANSGATGVAFLNDSIAIVGNPSLNSVTPVNVRRGTAGAEIAVGVYPQAMAAVNDTVFVLNANLVSFQPAGPSSISVLTGTPPRVVRTIPLSGQNAAAAYAAPDGRLYVVHSGSFGAGNGSLSIVDRRTLTEQQHITGFGEFPGGLVVDLERRVHVSSFGYGLAVWDAGSGSFLRAPDNAVAPGGLPSASGVGIDSEGRLYTLEADCRDPASAFRLTPQFTVEREYPTGICPIAIAFTKLQ